MDELVKRARAELEPTWDDVREARVLSRVLDDATTLEKRMPARHAKLAAAALAVMTAAAALGLSLREPAATGSRSVHAQPSAHLPPQPAVEAPSVLALADGSRAYLAPGAELQTLTQNPALVRLVQTKGEVRYEVKPDPLRPFTIQIGDVEVRVIGTVFTVAAEADGVRVSVERGRVAVRSGDRQVELSPGENLRLSSSDIKKSALRAQQPPPASETSAAPQPSSLVGQESAARLVEEADAARARGDLPGAERALRSVLARYPSSAQATSAAFTLGRIQRARGDFGAAARTFDGLRQHAPAGPLAEDALAESANAWALAGQLTQARALAHQYLARYPGGPHAERMRRLGLP